MQSHTVEGAGEVSLHVDEAGGGRPILLVHGLSQSRLCWRKQLQSDLTRDFRLVAPDLRGHGDSDKPRDEYGESALWADDLRSVVTALGLDDAVLVGWSYAGLVVLDYLERYGTDRISGVNFVGAISGIGTEKSKEVMDPGYAELLPGFVTDDATESVRTMRQFVDRCVYDDLSPEDRYFMLGYNVAVPPYVRDGLRDRTVAHESELSNLDVPALFTHGEEDAVVKPLASRRHAELVPDADLSLYPETGHTPFWERPDRFNAELREFASRL